jgi:hypothetical protein
LHLFANKVGAAQAEECVVNYGNGLGVSLVRNKKWSECFDSGNAMVLYIKKVVVWFGCSFPVYANYQFYGVVKNYFMSAPNPFTIPPPLVTHKTKLNQKQQYGFYLIPWLNLRRFYFFLRLLPFRSSVVGLISFSTLRKMQWRDERQSVHILAN